MNIGGGDLTDVSYDQRRAPNPAPSSPTSGVLQLSGNSHLLLVAGFLETRNIPATGGRSIDSEEVGVTGRSKDLWLELIDDSLTRKVAALDV